jgi:hypothetical protein
MMNVSAPFVVRPIATTLLMIGLILGRDPRIATLCASLLAFEKPKDLQQFRLLVLARVCYCLCRLASYVLASLVWLANWERIGWANGSGSGCVTCAPSRRAKRSGT